MLFSSTFFLFAFLPAVVLCYFGQRLVFKNRMRNATLLVFSYFFYICGAGELLAVLLLSTLADYFFGLWIGRYRQGRTIAVTLAIVANLGLLIYFKYTGFFIEQIQSMWGIRDLLPAGLVPLALPIGISFFTFQKLSYILDVYRGRVAPIGNLVDFALYVAMFPQLIAGPIIRFGDIQDQLLNRQETWDAFYAGVMRFCWGLVKKVLVANACGNIADAVFGLNPALLDTKVAWLGALAYTLQIYIDFSAYSDMAIGLGQMFGFKFRENFNYPYSARNLTEFWRRWHITLSTWFRDYLYIPLGGNRRGMGRTCFNLVVVTGLCGLWHGANWTFVVWGCYHGCLLIIERITGLRNITPSRLNAARRAFTLLLVAVGWVMFRADDIPQAMLFLKSMFTLNDHPLAYAVARALNYRNLVFMLAAVPVLFWPGTFQGTQWLQKAPRPLRAISALALVCLGLPYSVALLLDGVSDIFIYYQF